MTEVASVATPERAIEQMQSVLKVGHITPSCNSVLEPLSAWMTHPIAARLSHHFTRIPVERISLAAGDIEQFQLETMLAAARILSEARMNAIVWNGTSGSWKGTAGELETCRAIASETGVPATTATLAQLDILRRHEITRIAVAAPYTDDVMAAIASVYADEGFDVVSYAGMDMNVGREMANVPIPRIDELLRDADSPSAEAIVVICTGLPGALVVERTETALGKPVFDSVAVTVKRAMELVGVDDAPLPGWGALMMGASAVDGLLESSEDR